MTTLPDLADLDNLAYELTARSLREYGNELSPVHCDVLLNAAIVFGSMASGNVTGRYVFTLPAGLGKTQLMVCWIKAMVSLGFPWSVAIAGERVEELITIKHELMEGECPVPEDQIGLWHALEEASEPPTFENQEDYGTRPILLLTHARMQQGPEIAEGLKCRGESRSILFYDESLLTTAVWEVPYAPVVGQIKELVAGRDDDDAAVFLRSLMDTLDTEVTSQRRGGAPKKLRLPPHNPKLLQKAQILAREQGELRGFLQNPEADFRIIVAKGEGSKAIIIKPFKRVPIEELPRMIVMNASWPVRTLLKLANENMADKSLRMEPFEETWRFIQPRFKRYDHVEIRIMPTRRSGRSYAVDDADKQLGDHAIPKEIAELVASIPESEGVLIWTFKQSDKKDMPDFTKEIQDAIEQRLGDRQNLWIETFGKETATNRFKTCAHVVFVGTLELSPEKLAGLYVAETRDLTIPVPSEEIDRLNRGEIWHHVYQGMHRGACREVFVDDQGQTQAKPMKVWIFTRHHKQIKDELGPALPGVNWRTWKPHHMAGGLTKEAKGAEVIKDILDGLPDGKDRISLKVLKGMDPFLAVLSNPTFRRARNLMLIEEDSEWKRKGGLLVRKTTEQTNGAALLEGRPMPGAQGIFAKRHPLIKDYGDALTL